MKVPEFIPFHFDKFNSNLFKRYGAVGIGRWALIRKAVAEMPTLTINLNDIFERETLELDSGCSEHELTELLDYASQRRMIDPNLYGAGIVWVENLDTDLGRFFTAGKRHLPQRPQLTGILLISTPDFSEKFHEVTPTSEKKAEKTGIPTHETKRNETYVTDDTHGNARTIDFDGQKWSREFQEIYGKAGKPRPTDTAFANCLGRMIKSTEPEFSSYADAFEMLKSRAAQHRTYHIRAGTETRFIPNPENWLEDDSWKIDWPKKTLEYKNEEKTAKGGIKNGTSITERVIKFNNENGI